ncbi:MAG: molybdopterin oxidoreductase family protein [Sphingomonadales bacterium]
MSFNPFNTPVEDVDLTPKHADEVKTTTCYMCACRCGIRVHLKDGDITYIDGNPDHPVNKGVLCAKGSSGLMQHLSPSKLKKPMLRSGPRGSGEFNEIEWDDALLLATQWLSEVRNDDPKKLAFFTGRDQSQSLTGWWASQFGTPNHAAHGGFCSVNMAAAGLYTVGGSFWEFGEPDWELTKYFMMFGVAEDHDSNPIKAGLGKLKTKGDAKFLSVNPVRTGYSAIADEWVGIKPGTDGMFIGALLHELINAGKIDFEYLSRYTNAAWLVINNPNTENHGLFARDHSGNPLCFDSLSNAIVNAENIKVSPKLVGEYSLKDGTKVTPSFELFAKRFAGEEFSPEKASKITGISQKDIKRIAFEVAEAAFEKEVVLNVEWTDWAGRKQDKMIGRPVAIHAMRGISAHSNGFHTCRMLHLLQMILGAIDTPGSFRYKPPFPKPLPPGPIPHGDSAPNTPLKGPPIGNPKGPEDLLVYPDGTPKRIDKAFSWENPMSIHGAMHMVLHNAWKGDPYKIDVLFMYMANMAWNSSMNVKDVLKYLTDKDSKTGEYKIKHFIYSDAYYSETVAYADLILPDTTYLERWDCISLLDRPISTAHGPGDSIRQPIVKPNRDVRPFQDVLIDLGARLGLPAMVNEDMSPKFKGGYKDYLVNHERMPGIGPLAGWRGKDGNSHGRGGVNPNQLDKYIENGCNWSFNLPESQLYYKHSNKDYLEYSHGMGWIPSSDKITLSLYDEGMQKFRLAAEGYGDVVPPDNMKDRVKTYFDPLPIWYPPFEGDIVDNEEYPLFAITQRPAHMYHSWGAMNAWLRQIISRNALFIHNDVGKEHGLEDGDWTWVISHNGRIKVQVKLMNGVNKDTVWTWNAIGKRKGAWGLDEDAPEFKKGFLLNHLISDLLPKKKEGYDFANADPVTGQAAWFDLKVRLEKCLADEKKQTEPFYSSVRPKRWPKIVKLMFGRVKK